MKRHFLYSALKSVFLFLMVLSSNSQTFGQLLEIENTIPKNVPIKIEVKNQDSANWIEDLEIEVTNTGKKPIYFLLLFLTLDKKTEKGDSYGFSFNYGDKTLYSTEGLAQENVFATYPNETYNFKIKEDSVRGWKLHKNNNFGTFIEPRKGYLKLGWLSFGDGTGITANGTTYKKKT